MNAVIFRGDRRLRRVWQALAILVLLTAALATVLSAGARGASSGLVAAYAFDEGSGTVVTDASGIGNNGTITNATWATSGKYGKALQFNGTNALVTIPDAASLHLSSSMTLEAWVDPTTVTSAWRDVVYKGNDNYYLSATSTNASKPDAGMIAGGTYADAFGTAKLSTNKWTFLTETYDGSTLRLYVNGTQVSSTAHAGAIATSTNPLQIGGDSIYGQYFAGMIDNVRVYNVPLTATQIQTDENTAITPIADTTPPTQPGTLSANAVTGGEVDLSWGASTDNVGVTGYLIERCSGGGCSNFTQIASVSGTTTTYKDTSVSANTSYSYRVRATDAAGNLSPYSNTATATTPAPDTTPPSQPGTLSANTVSASEVDLSWGASTDNVGVTGYLIERCSGSGCTSFAQVASVGGTTTTYKDTSVVASTSYSYRVRATDAAGNLSPYSNTASATTPAPPSGLVAAYAFDEGSGTTVTDASGNGNNGTITNATWATSGKYGKALQFNGTNALVSIPDAASLHLTTALTLEAWVDPTTVTSAWRDVVYKGNDNYYLSATSSNASKPDGGLIAGGTYADAFGTSALPTNTWSFLTETYDGSTLRLYVNGTQVSSTAHMGTITTSTNPLSIGGDSIYGQYFAGMIDNVRIYNVALSAAQIQSDEASAVSSTPDTTPPTQPGTLSANAVTGGEVDLSWGASTDNIGVTGYLIERCSGSGCTNFTQIASVGATTTTYKDTSVSANTSYSYRVRATDAAGNLSPYSNTATLTTPAPDTTPPSQPGTLTAGAVSATEVDLSWGASTDNVGVTGYLIERCSGSGCTSFAQVASVGGTTTTYKDTGALASTSYSYRVRATDAAGNLGPYSNTASATTPAAPSGLVAAYAFDEGSGTTVTDASGNGNNGTISNATWATSGKYGKALQFNGTNALVSIPNAASLDLTTGMTLEAWVNPSVVNANWRDVIYKADDNYYLSATSTSASVPDAGLIAGGTYADAFGTSALPTNTWSFLTETYDGTTVRLYVNGTQVSSTAHTGSISTSTNPLTIGGDTPYSQYFTGLLDNVRVYNVALSAAQIQTDMATPVSGPTAPGSLTANGVTTGEVDLAWSASTDNISNVTGYQVERCSGSGCSNFTQIASVAAPSTTFNDTSVSANTTYNYRVRAVDTVGNVGPYSNIATGTTFLSISPGTVPLTFDRTEQFAVQGPGSSSVTWSVDSVAGGNATVGTITAGGLYTPPSTVGQHTVTATSGASTASATVYVTNDPGVFTYHNDNMRTGQDLNETVLTPSNVNSAHFGKLFSYPLDGLTYSSPLYVQNVNIPGQGYHNLVIVATEHDSVYAFDADGRSSAPIWHDNFTNPAAGVTTVPAGDVDTSGNQDIPVEVGITQTPVIDPATGTIYVVAKTKEASGSTTTYVQRLHALDLATGAEKDGGPVVIQASVPGTGNGSSGGTLKFDPLRENERSAGLLNNGVLYLAFTSHADTEIYHGWVLAYNPTTLQQAWAYSTTPNALDGSVWMDGDGIAADSSNNLYFITGNGTMDANTSGGKDYGDSYEKLSPSGTVLDYFSPSNQATLQSQDLDLGSGGVLLLPDQSGTYPHEMVSAGKDGTVYLVNRDNMGHYSSSSNNVIQTLLTVFPNNQSDPTTGGNFSSPVYFNGSVYFAPVANNVQAFSLTNGLLSTSATSQSPETYGGRGGTMSISANGSSNGILWTLQTGGTGQPGILHAYAASNLSNELYNSNQAVGGRDALDEWDKFTVPVVANGQVFVTSNYQLTVYGLLP